MASQLDRLEALLSEQEATIAAAFEEFIRAVNSEPVWGLIADRIEAGDIEGALSIVDTYTVRFASIMPVVQQAVGAATAAEFASTLGQFAIAISFDPSHPRAAQLARVNRLNLIREFTTEQRAVTRQAISDAFMSGTGTATTARAFRGSIGLTRTMQGWVSSYEALLRGRDKRALDRALRDRRFDRSVRNAIELQKPLTEAQIENMVERYRARTLIMRSENIARTEALRSTSQAREEALLQMLEQTQMDPRRVRRVWNATHDGRTRGWHETMQSQQRRIGEAFEDGNGNRLLYPGDPSAPPDTTINCRCSLTFAISPPS